MKTQSLRTGISLLICLLLCTTVSGQYLGDNVKLLKTEAKHGDAQAAYRLGEMYRDGIGVQKKDFKEAQKWFKTAESLGHEDAQEAWNITSLFMKAEEGDVVGQYDLARSLEGKPEFDEVRFSMYQKAAAQGSSRATYELGRMYYEGGPFVARDYTEAVKWFRKAAPYGQADAQLALGACYDYGYGVKMDYSKAAEWYRKSAEQGHPSGLNNLAHCYYIGHGVRKNYDEAARLFRKAMDLGNAAAACNLALLYENGYGVEQDYEEAKKLYGIAIERGYDAAKELLDNL